MRVLITTLNGREYSIDDMPEGDCLELVSDFDQGDSRTMTFTMDGAIVHLARHYVVTVELDQ